MNDNERTPKTQFSWISTGVALVSYFVLKYGVAAQFFGEDELSFVYSLLLIAACMFFGKAVEKVVEERKQQ